MHDIQYGRAGIIRVFFNPVRAPAVCVYIYKYLIFITPNVSYNTTAGHRVSFKCRRPGGGEGNNKKKK